MPPVTLDTCADEPIHLPGPTQPHGVLLALLDGRLAAWSANLVDPIDADVVSTLFQPQLRRTRPAVRNSDGLGLYIAAEHGTDVHYRYDAPQVVFSVRLRALG